MMEGILSGTQQDVLATVLIVDDINDNLQLVGNVLMDMDVDLSYANNGIEALEAVSFHKPDLILLDVNMPEMTGFEVCEILKKNPETRNIPVIFLTAKTEPEDMITGFRVGGIDYISKPFDSRELTSRVRSHLDLGISKRIITDRNEQLKMLNKELEESLATKNKFFSIIAHDLKEPFQTLIGFSDLLLKTLEERDPEDIIRLVKYIHQTSLHGFAMLNNLLDWSRSQTGSIVFNPVRINLARMVEELLVAQSAAAAKKNIRLDSGSLVDYSVVADEKMIQTVIRNLISNALKFTSPGGEVSLESRELDTEIEISVSDTGLGIRKENLSKLFSISENISTPGTNRETGTGLGLILCKEFVEKNGGRIRVISEPGKGSKFSFTIPKIIAAY